METVHTKYIPVKGREDITHLKVELYYTLGGYNTYKAQNRGYWLSVTPVKREEKYECMMESFEAFSGEKMLLHPCDRKSKKAETIAKGKSIMQECSLIDLICQKNHIYIIEGER